MINRTTNRLRIVAAFFATQALLFNANKGHAMEPEITNRVVELFATTKTVCIGRFLLDVPAEAEVIYGPARLPYWIERWPLRGEKLDDVVKRRIAEILSTDRARARGPLAKKDSMFGKILSGSVVGQQIIFGASEASGNIYSLESVQTVGEDLYIQKATAYGDEYRDVVARLNLVAPQLRPRMEGEVPSMPGICLDGAFIIEPSSPIYEALGLGIRLRTFPDVHFSIETIKKKRIVEGDSIEARAAAAEEFTRRAGAGEWYDRVKVFRRGARTIGRWKGTEFLTRKPPINQVMESHEFAFHSHGESGNALVPAVDIELDTGVKDNKASRTRTSITDDEALYLWDRLTSSIRIRPTVEPSKE